jgi:hypothetical protein
MLWSPGFTGGTATAADIRLLLNRRSIVVEDRADAAFHGNQRIAAVASMTKTRISTSPLLTS